MTEICSRYHFVGLITPWNSGERRVHLTFISVAIDGSRLATCGHSAHIQLRRNKNRHAAFETQPEFLSE
jgi:hypothetical protein